MRVYAVTTRPQPEKFLGSEWCYRLECQQFDLQLRRQGLRVGLTALRFSLSDMPGELLGTLSVQQAQAWLGSWYDESALASPCHRSSKV